MALKNNKKAGLGAYIATPLMTIFLYGLISTILYLLFKDIQTVVFLIILTFIFVFSMILFALVPLKIKNTIRMITVFLFTSFLVGLACILGRQNFQIEGLFFYLVTGTFGGAVFHYLIGKIIGPIFTGRTWCSWACWSILVFDLLPFKGTKKNKGFGKPGLRKFRFIHFILSLTVVAVLVFVFSYNIHDPNQDPNQPGTLAALYWFLIGNILYYAAGIIMAFIFKDNRAFCKYLCPASVFLRLSSTISLLRIKGDKNKCTSCNTCVNACLFDINIPEYIKQGSRVSSKECVMCMKCIAVCPEGALSSSIGFDLAIKERLKIK